MSSAHSEYDDADFDDSLFPAYAKYINGVETPWYEPHDRRLNYLPYTDAGPIPYTNTRTSRSARDTSFRSATAEDSGASTIHPRLYQAPSSCILCRDHKTEATAGFSGTLWRYNSTHASRSQWFFREAPYASTTSHTPFSATLLFCYRQRQPGRNYAPERTAAPILCSFAYTNGYEQAMPSPQYEAQVLPQQHIKSMPHQAPVQQLPQQYAHPEPENLLPNTPPNISGDLRGTINAQISKYIQSCSLLAASPADPEGAARRNAAQNWQNDFRAFLPPAGLQYLDETVAKILSYHPVQAAQPHLAPQVCPHPSMPSHQNVPSHPYAPDQAGVIAEPLRRYIFATLPKYFGAVRAHEIVRRMIIERNEGRNPMALLQI
ncbi:hypothetical protein SNOG_01390 [Parastagonospora nodorum SN15]|uniref:Uncharacterized protein n=1 Tax=Phaeosphaeria nodorum (strain SN15 / ATCC MYA-4574 / FGSC 10173) TaxID=321614 RepID=Q0V3M4_PHANO|nr:hypothetical protein SNOG_01390 [Parastagonospora nodorum SN15]EAT91039.2 hypothetical protein SNOG_01390 [Parastagonospora nodorum SN15]